MLSPDWIGYYYYYITEWDYSKSTASGANNGKVPGGSSRGSPTQREGGLLLPIHDKAATVSAKFMQLGFEVGSGVVAIIRPLQSSSPVIRTHSFPVVVAEISDPSPKAPTDSQIAQNCFGHLLKLLTFHLFLNCQRISFVK